MKPLSRIALGTLLTVFCTATAFAQTTQGACNPYTAKTRAEVKADLVQWRAAGYEPLDWIDYPDNAQRAGRIVAQQRAATGSMSGCAQ